MYSQMCAIKWYNFKSKVVRLVTAKEIFPYVPVQVFEALLLEDLSLCTCRGARGVIIRGFVPMYL